MKRTITLLMMTSLVLTTFLPSFGATSTKPTFSTTPTQQDLKLRKNTSVPYKAWLEDKKGNKTEVTPLKDLPKPASPGTITAQSFNSGAYTYTYNTYGQYQSQVDKYHFFVSAVEVVNYTSSNMTLKYTQQQTKTVTWTFTGRVSAEAELSAAMFSKIKGTIGIDGSRSATELSGTSYEFTATVHPGKLGRIAKYKQGLYSAGTAYWDKWLPSTNGTKKWVSFYNESAGVWAVDEFNDIFRAWEGNP
jgi:hypothetical protein